MKQTVLAVLAIFAFSAFAADDDFALVTCDVQTLKDAQKCMEREAAKVQDYEEPNDGWASDRVDMLAGVMRVLGFKKEYVDQAKAADFAGAVGIHMDEHHVVYYSIKKGKNVRPEILTDMNVADLTYAFEDGSKIPPAGLFALGLESFKKSDIYDDIVEHLDYVKQERKEQGDREQGEDPGVPVPASEYTTLKCWDTYTKKGSMPLFVAKILSNSKIDVTEFNGGDFYTHVHAPTRAIEGNEITSKHSPYRGNQEFDFAGSRLILPLSLDKNDLVQAYKVGIGMGPKENGVLIGDLEEDGDGAGSHFSVRLSCRSYAY